MSKGEWRYLAWGIDMVVPFPVLELREFAGTTEPDLIIRAGLPPAHNAALHLVLPSGARVAITGREAYVNVTETARLHPSLLRSILAVVLRGQGRAVLHAAALRLDGRTIVIAGPTGSGKTTLAAAICLVGGLHITDELCAIAMDSATGIVLPATHALAMRPDGYDLAGYGAAQSIPPERWRNGRVLVSVPAYMQPSSLDALYLLEQGGALGVEIVPAGGAELAQALLAARFQPDVGPPACAARELDALARIAASGIAHRLRRAADALPNNVVEAIRAHLSAQVVPE